MRCDRVWANRAGLARIRSNAAISYFGQAIFFRMLALVYGILYTV